MTKEEFLDLAEKLRPWTEQAMKIEVAPWIKDYVDDMENLYTELTVEHFRENVKGIEYLPLKDYKEIYEESQRTEEVFSAPLSIQSEKVLAKGDPGMGKTTLAKKIAWDWAKRSFTRFCIIFLVYLKFVSPEDAIEDVIIKQTPPLQKIGVTSNKIQHILNKFGSRCHIDSGWSR